MISATGFVLLLDSGNTRLKGRAARLDKGQSLAQQTLAEFSIANTEAEQLMTVLQEWQSQFGVLQAVYGVSVAGEVLQNRWEEIVRTSTVNLSVPITWLAVNQSDLGLYNHYALTQMGKDRWYGVLGAYACYRQHRQEQIAFPRFLYLSFGTATTIDAVFQQDYVGGVIFPGVQLMQKSLFQGTAQLPEVQLPTNSAIAFPKATYPAIEAGIAIAQAGAVMRQVQKFYRDYGVVPELYVSGGARKAVLPEVQQAYQEWAAPLGLADLSLTELTNPVLDGIQSVLVSKSPS